ncbi:hypothetical protein D3C78_313520 [compost metagenome]
MPERADVRLVTVVEMLVIAESKRFWIAPRSERMESMVFSALSSDVRVLVDFLVTALSVSMVMVAVVVEPLVVVSTSAA